MTWKLLGLGHTDSRLLQVKSPEHVTAQAGSGCQSQLLASEGSNVIAAYSAPSALLSTTSPRGAHWQEAGDKFTGTSKKYAAGQRLQTSGLALGAAFTLSYAPLNTSWAGFLTQRWICLRT